jgi:signal transduction histidine kinase
MEADPVSTDAGLEARHLEALTSVAAAVSNSTDLDAALAIALDAALAAVALDAGGIYLLDDAGELRATRHHRGLPPDYPPAVARFKRGESVVGRALESSSAVVVEDLSTSSEVRDVTRALGLRTCAFVPLSARGRAVGVLAVGGFSLRTFRPEELRLFSALGGLLGGAIDSSRLLETARRHLKQVRALWEIDRAIVEDRELGEVLTTIAREAALLGGGDSAIGLDEEGRGPRIAGSLGERALQALGNPSALASPPGGVWHRGEPHCVRLAEPGEPQVALVVPLVAGERSLGGLVVVKAADALRADDLTLLETFGHQAAVALAKARLRNNEKRREGQLALVSGASEIAASTLDVDDLLGAIARYVQRSFGYHSVGVYLVEPEARGAFLAGAAGAATLVPRGDRVRFGSGIVGWVAEHGEAVLANDVRREPRCVASPRRATKAELAVPVRLSGSSVAVIHVESDRVGAFDDGDLVALDAIAAQLASAIRNARLFGEKLRTLRNLEILQEITNVLNSELDLDALLERIARRSVEAVGPAQMGAVLLYDDEALAVRSSFGYPNPEALARVRLAFHQGLPGGVFVSGQGRVVSGRDRQREDAVFQEALGDAYPTSALCVPISLPQEKLGVLLLESVASAEAFDADDLRFAATLAHEAAIAMGNALQLSRIVELDRQRRHYLSNVSHEFRSPLTVIQGYIEAVMDGTARDQTDQFLRIAHEHCLRLGRLIDEVLEVSRLERGVARRHLSWGSVNLRVTLGRVLAAQRHEALLKGLEIVESVAPDLPEVPGDERLLYLLALNLVENAVKFTPRGGRVEVELRPDGGELLLSVGDSGAGIPAEDRERIFEKFYTLDAGPTRAHGGAGIGLYLAREVVAVHGGRLSVEGIPSGGSRFLVRLPLESGPER